MFPNRRWYPHNCSSQWQRWMTEEFRHPATVIWWGRLKEGAQNRAPEIEWNRICHRGAIEHIQKRHWGPVRTSSRMDDHSCRYAWREIVIFGCVLCPVLFCCGVRANAISCIKILVNLFVWWLSQWSVVANCNKYNIDCLSTWLPC